MVDYLDSAEFILFLLHFLSLSSLFLLLSFLLGPYTRSVVIVVVGFLESRKGSLESAHPYM